MSFAGSIQMIFFSMQTCTIGSQGGPNKMASAKFLWLHFLYNRSLTSLFFFHISGHTSLASFKKMTFSNAFHLAKWPFLFFLSEHVSRTEKQSNFEPFFLEYKLKEKCEFETHLSPLSSSAVFRPRSPSPAVLDFDKEGEVVGGDDSQLYKLNCFWWPSFVPWANVVPLCGFFTVVGGE